MMLSAKSRHTGGFFHIRKMEVSEPAGFGQAGLRLTKNRRWKEDE